LELCKIKNQLSTLEGNDYSNNSLDTYQLQLFKLFDKITEELLSNKENFSSYPAHEKESIRECFTLISISVRFLEDSILNIIPFETIYCLRKALTEWIEEDVTFVTSLQGNRYSFNPILSLNENLFLVIKDTFGIDFNTRLIQISIPKHEVNDYFFTAALYHELAHYVDMKLEISDSVLAQNHGELEGLEKEKKLNHLMEHFADLFSAQYIGDTFVNFLEIKAINEGENHTHPGTGDRIDIIYDFTEGEENAIIEELNIALVSATHKKLEKRYLIPENINDFFQFIPPVINSDKELHGLFVSGWNIWLKEKDKFKEESAFKVYTYINNLTEKSISNYMISTQWDNLKI